MQGNLNTYSSFQAVTPSDTAFLTCSAIYVGAAGNLAVATETGTAVTLIGVPAGSILPINLIQGRIMATNTTATSIVALA